MPGTVQKTGEEIVKAFNQMRDIAQFDNDDKDSHYAVGRTHDFLEQVVREIGKKEQILMKSIALTGAEGHFLRDDKGAMLWKKGHSMDSFTELRQNIMEETFEVKLYQSKLSVLMDNCVQLKPIHIASTRWCFEDDIGKDPEPEEEKTRADKRKDIEESKK